MISPEIKEEDETRAYNYAMTLRDSSKNIYSYVLNGEEYIYEEDRILDYYKETGVSFQIRGLLLDIIKNELLTWSETCDKYVDNLSDESKGMREEDDRLYSPISKLISKVTQ